MRPTVRFLTALLLTFLASPSSGLDIFLNGGQEDRVILESCDDFNLKITDNFNWIGYRQETYTVYRDSSALDSELFTAAGLWGTRSVNHTFSLPAVAGAYQVRRSGVGSSVSRTVTVLLHPSLECDPPFEVRSFGERIWFEGDDWTHRPVVGDFDNDNHFDDIAYRGKCGTGTECWRVHLGNVSSFTVSNFGGSMWFEGSDAINAPVVGDFDNDTFLDDIAYYGKCGAGDDCWRVHLGDRNSFTVSNFGGGLWFAGTTPEHMPVVGNFDDDEFIDDIAYYGRCGDGTKCWRVHLSDGNSFTTDNYGDGLWFSGSDPSNMPVVGDFDRDSRFDDIAYAGHCGAGTPCWRVHSSDGNSFAIANFGAGMWFGNSTAIRAPLTGDMNGDRRHDDIIYYGKCGNNANKWRLHHSNGSAFNTECPVGSTGIWFEGSSPRNIPVVGDFDNDRERDDLIYYGKCGGGNDCWRAHIWD
ncbi:MAG: hypothetical protein AAGM22_09185 [Acidobacteriota bacterium]